jgi:UDP-N-acetylmuramoyl-tripeptide--D-alanyl-D-alanine ligase
MQFMASEIAQVTGGTLVGPDVMCHGASIDTRTIEAGALFVPIIGDRDGHDYLPVAKAAGCAAYLTSRDDLRGGTAIVVDDTRVALTRLGKAARGRHEGPVIAITGSVGKTSVKDLTAAAIGVDKAVSASERSFNNELGVPLTLINAPDDTEVLIVEMGARGIGHIAELCDIASPTTGIVTYVGAVHTSEFGSVERVARGKAELVESLPENGRAILNRDCAPVAAMVSLSKAPVTTYGVNGDFEAHNVTLDEELRPTFDVSVLGNTYPVTLPVHGLHNVSNALAAIAAAAAVGVMPDRAAEGLATVGLSPWRMEFARTSRGTLVINDAYNANAVSTESALRSLAAIPAERRFAVLGTMAELGDRHDADHRAMLDLCNELKIWLIPYREAAYGLPVKAEFAEVLAELGQLDEYDAVLVKGSRVAGLETLAAELLEPDPQS